MEKSKIVTVGLALFLGIFGVHRFYLGQVKYGLIYLATLLGSLIFLFLGIGIVGIWVLVLAAVVDFIYFLTMPSEKFEKRFNRKNTSQQDPI